MINLMFSDEDIEKIRQNSLSYDCSCPAKVTESIAMLRALYDYQHQCIQRGNLSDRQTEVHKNIAKSAIAAHTKLEACLETILTLEGWDRETLEMPEGIRSKLSNLTGD